MFDIVTVATIIRDTFGTDTLAAMLGDDMSLTIRNQNHATAMWLDMGQGAVAGGLPALQTWLEVTCGGSKATGGSVSPSAASQRMCIQRYPEKYRCREADRTTYPIQATGRTGRVRKVQATDDQRSALAALLQEKAAAK